MYKNRRYSLPQMGNHRRFYTILLIQESHLVFRLLLFDDNLWFFLAVQIAKLILHAILTALTQTAGENLLTALFTV